MKKCLHKTTCLIGWKFQVGFLEKEVLQSVNFSQGPWEGKKVPQIRNIRLPYLKNVDCAMPMRRSKHCNQKQYILLLGCICSSDNSGCIKIHFQERNRRSCSASALRSAILGLGEFIFRISAWLQNPPRTWNQESQCELIQRMRLIGHDGKGNAIFTFYWKMDQCKYAPNFLLKSEMSNLPKFWDFPNAPVWIIYAIFKRGCQKSYVKANFGNMQDFKRLSLHQVPPACWHEMKGKNMDHIAKN